MNLEWETETNNQISPPARQSLRLTTKHTLSSSRNHPHLPQPPGSDTTPASPFQGTNPPLPGIISFNTSVLLLKGMMLPPTPQSLTQKGFIPVKRGIQAVYTCVGSVLTSGRRRGEGRSSVCDLLPFTASCMRVTLPGTDVCGALGLWNFRNS